MRGKIDIKDNKILFALDKDSRIGLPELARQVGLSKEVVFHRLNKLVKKDIILRFHTVSASYRLGLIAFKVYLRLQDISKREYEGIERYLIACDDVFWVASCKGRWDLMFGVWARSIEDFFKIHDAILDRFSKHIQEKELSIGRRTVQYNRRWMYYDQLEPVEFDFGENEPSAKLDEEDHKILNILVDDSRTKIVEMAKKTGISSDMVSYRIRKMEQDRIIRGYKCLFNAKELGYVTCKSFVFFKNINEEKKRAFLEYFKMVPQSINVVTTFAPWDLELMFEVDDFEQFYVIMEDIKERFKDIVKFYESVLITSEPKQVFIK